eukprot:TRINITY_DN21104_c0_g1_i1.p1 TRINITY_DN21104_c0_g1~~TRINITY_DN21104_c0_g1_i1.p1  ORF type:complete len:308 (-),score=28.18 TRINITY_DN21104_c0_g1_i1:174-1097(-)
MPGVEDWWRNLGPVTKVLLGASASLTALSLCSMIQPVQVVLHWPLVISQHQWWRLLTNFLWLGDIGGNGTLGTIFGFYMTHEFSTRLEDDTFNRDTAIYVWLFVLMVPLFWAASAISWYIFSYPLMLMEVSLHLAMMWVFCMKNPHAVFNVFSFRVEAPYLPWVYCGINYFLSGGGGGLPYFGAGIVVGWIYMFLANTTSYTMPPQILRNLLATGSFGAGEGIAQPAPPQQAWQPPPAGQGAFQWQPPGAGQPLHPMQQQPPPQAMPPRGNAAPNGTPPPNWGMGILGGVPGQGLQRRNPNPNGGEE